MTTCGRFICLSSPLQHQVDYEKRELDVKSPAGCAKFTLNQITKAYWCLTVGAGLQASQQYPRETR